MRRSESYTGARPVPLATRLSLGACTVPVFHAKTGLPVASSPVSSFLVFVILYHMGFLGISVFQKISFWKFWALTRQKEVLDVFKTSTTRDHFAQLVSGLNPLKGEVQPTAPPFS